jgi:hypothetical protein
MKSVSFSALLALAAMSLIASPAFAQAKKQPPSCSQITFRPVTPEAGEGEQEAGLYKSRFGRIIVTGIVKSGRVENHFVTVNNKRPDPASNLPASVTACAQSKKAPPPSQARTDSCVGDRLQVLVSHEGDKRYVLLYARDGGKWQLCSAGTA